MPEQDEILEVVVRVKAPRLPRLRNGPVVPGTQQRDLTEAVEAQKVRQEQDDRRRQVAHALRDEFVAAIADVAVKGDVTVDVQTNDLWDGRRGV